MKNRKKIIRLTFSFLLILATTGTLIGLSVSVNAKDETNISYTFSGKHHADSGYAEGTITLSSKTAGTYSLYWANDEQILDGYYKLAEIELNGSESKSFTMDYHTAIPAEATKIIAKSGDTTAAIYSIPKNKQLSADSGKLLYTFNSYSDVHIDNNGFYINAEAHWKEALDYGVKKGTDFIVSSGDMVTNAAGPENEWNVYERILSESDYVNPVWEADGNHDMRCGVESGLTSFIRASGTNSTTEELDSKKPYYCVREKTTGDLFIFMALETGYNPSVIDEFSQDQLDWVDSLLETYYGTGINIYIVEHSPIQGFGAGDRMDNPYYKGLLSEQFESTVRFKSILQKYPNLIFMSGHTHEDFSMGYNYSNENGTACHMIHNPAVVGSTKAAKDDLSLDYNHGIGYNSQGYYTEVYENRIVFYGANLTDGLIYPQYCYIMEGSRTVSQSNADSDINTQSPGEPTFEIPISDKISKASEALNKYYKYASYDQYQSLKKLYYRYKNEPTADEKSAAEFESLIAALSEIDEYFNKPTVYTVGNTYYFLNTKSWNKVYAYAWSDSDSNAGWPGVKLSKTGKKQFGLDIYVVRFDYDGQYNRIIFTDGTNQTIDIALENYPKNGFYPGARLSDGTYRVVNTSLLY